MGVVVAARHLELDERVALKFLLPALASSPDAAARFAREARAAVKIRSEHVARVTDVGKLESGAPYMVMEYLEGEDFAVLAERRGALPIEQAIDFVLQACEAVAEAHALGIIHRDLKPANLFMTTRADGSPCVKVLDFGLSKLKARLGLGPDAAMTKTATIMGTPLYMSPEQMSSTRDADARTDLWAIGTILHELLAGSVAFSAETLPQLCRKILMEPPPPLRTLRPDAPAEVERAILRCLEKDRDRRFPGLAEFAAAIGPFGSPGRRRPSSGSPRSSGSISPGRGALGRPGPARRPARRPPSRTPPGRLPPRPCVRRGPPC